MNERAHRIRARLDAEPLALRMLQELSERYDSTDALAEDPLHWIDACSDVALVLDDSAMLLEHSVYGRYDAEPDTPRIIVAARQSRGRQHFTALHELGHHILRTTSAFADELIERDDFGAALEERAADRFAALVLIPEAVVAPLLGEGVPTAAAVISSWAHLPAVSMHAVMVRAIANFSSEGYLILLDADGRVLSCVSRDAPPLAVGSDQSATTIWQNLTARDGATASDTRFRFRGVTHGDAYYAQARRLPNDTVLIVAARERVPWQLSVRRQEFHPDRHWWTCERCSEGFEVWNPPCSICATPICPSCGHCSCGAVLEEFLCTECFIRRPPSERSTTPNICTQCAT